MVLTARRAFVGIAMLCMASTRAAAQRGPDIYVRGSDGPRPRLFGFALECESCEPSRGSGPRGRSPLAVWHYTSYPRVVAVTPKGAADRAGIKVNDLVVAIEGLSLLTADGAKRLSTVWSGETVRLTVQRDNKSMDFSLTLRPVPPQAIAEGAHLGAARGFGPGRGRGVLSADTLIYAGHVGTSRVEVAGAGPVSATTDSTGALLLRIGGTTVLIRPPDQPTPRTGPASKRP